MRTAVLSVTLLALAASAEGAAAPFPKAARQQSDLRRMQGEWVAVGCQVSRGGREGDALTVCWSYDGR